MHGRHRLWTWKMLVIVAFLALTSPCHAGGLSLDAKAQGLAHYIMAMCHDLEGQSTLAIAEYQKSVKFNPKEAAPRLKLGAYYLRLNKPRLAARQLKAALRYNPQEVQAHYLLGLMYSSENKFDLAANEYILLLNLAAEDDPANTEVYMYLGQLYFAQEKYSKAIQQFKKILEIDPENVTALHFFGSIFLAIGEYANAETALSRALELQPAHSEALNSLGYLYVQQGIHLDKAMRLIRQAIKIDPANGAYYDSLGWALYKKGRYAESLVALQKAEGLVEDELLYDHLGDVYKALKDYPRALQYWRKSLDLDPHQRNVKQKLKETKKWIVLPSNRRQN